MATVAEERSSCSPGTVRTEPTRERMVERYDLHVPIAMHEALYREMLAERASRSI